MTLHLSPLAAFCVQLAAHYGAQQRVIRSPTWQNAETTHACSSARILRHFVFHPVKYTGRPIALRACIVTVECKLHVLARRRSTAGKRHSRERKRTAAAQERFCTTVKLNAD